MSIFYKKAVDATNWDLYVKLSDFFIGTAPSTVPDKVTKMQLEPKYHAQFDKASGADDDAKGASYAGSLKGIQQRRVWIRDNWATFINKLNANFAAANEDCKKSGSTDYQATYGGFRAYYINYRETHKETYPDYIGTRDFKDLMQSGIRAADDETGKALLNKIDPRLTDDCRSGEPVASEAAVEEVVPEVVQAQPEDYVCVDKKTAIKYENKGGQAVGPTDDNPGGSPQYQELKAACAEAGENAVLMKLSEYLALMVCVDRNNPRNAQENSLCQADGNPGPYELPCAPCEEPYEKMTVDEWLKLVAEISEGDSPAPEGYSHSPETIAKIILGIAVGNLDISKVRVQTLSQTAGNTNVYSRANVKAIGKGAAQRRTVQYLISLGLASNHTWRRKHHLKRLFGDEVMNCENCPGISSDNYKKLVLYATQMMSQKATTIAEIVTDESGTQSFKNPTLGAYLSKFDQTDGALPYMVYTAFEDFIAGGGASRTSSGDEIEGREERRWEGSEAAERIRNRSDKLEEAIYGGRGAVMRTEPADTNEDGVVSGEELEAFKEKLRTGNPAEQRMYRELFGSG